MPKTKRACAASSAEDGTRAQAERNWVCNAEYLTHKLQLRSWLNGQELVHAQSFEE